MDFVALAEFFPLHGGFPPQEASDSVPLSTFFLKLRPGSLEPAVEWKMESFQMVALAPFGMGS